MAPHFTEMANSHQQYQWVVRVMADLLFKSGLTWSRPPTSQSRYCASRRAWHQDRLRWRGPSSSPRSKISTMQCAWSSTAARGRSHLVCHKMRPAAPALIQRRVLVVGKIVIACALPAARHHCLADGGHRPDPSRSCPNCVCISANDLKVPHQEEAT